jgi:hypothetical protein
MVEYFSAAALSIERRHRERGEPLDYGEQVLLDGAVHFGEALLTVAVDCQSAWLGTSRAARLLLAAAAPLEPL